MPRNFSVNLAGLKWKDPRVAMRAVLGILLLANLVTAVIAFKPFGGSADDLRRDRNALQQQLGGVYQRLHCIAAAQESFDRDHANLRPQGVDRRDE